MWEKGTDRAGLGKGGGRVTDTSSTCRTLPATDSKEDKGKSKSICRVRVHESLAKTVGIPAMMNSMRVGSRKSCPTCETPVEGNDGIRAVTIRRSTSA